MINACRKYLMSPHRNTPCFFYFKVFLFRRKGIHDSFVFVFAQAVRPWTRALSFHSNYDVTKRSRDDGVRKNRAFRKRTKKSWKAEKPRVHSQVLSKKVMAAREREVKKGRNSNSELRFLPEIKLYRLSWQAGVHIERDRIFFWIFLRASILSVSVNKAAS